MSSAQFKSASMKNLWNPTATSFIVPFSFDAFGKHYSSIFEDQTTDKMNDLEKMKTTARQCLHRYIFIICHTIQHFGYNLAAEEIKLIRNTCDETLQWMWYGDKTLEHYRQRIVKLLRICNPIMKQLFQVEQQNVIVPQKMPK